MNPHVLIVDRAVVRIWDGGRHVQTRLSGNRVVEAAPQHGAEDVARAASLGYRDVVQMNLEHDLPGAKNRTNKTNTCMALSVDRDMKLLFPIAAGDVFGVLTVLSEESEKRRSVRLYRCRCVCGRERLVASQNLRRGKHRKCDCARAVRLQVAMRRPRTHGELNKPIVSAEYETWRQMKQRCLNPRSRHYKNYGGRGITVCPEWRDSFELFLEHVGRRPSPLHSLDRIDNDRGYEPGNVRWATAVEQQRNRRGLRLITAFNKTQSVAAWCEETGLTHATVLARLNKGWTDPVQLLGPPSRRRRNFAA